MRRPGIPCLHLLRGAQSSISHRAASGGMSGWKEDHAGVERPQEGGPPVRHAEGVAAAAPRRHPGGPVHHRAADAASSVSKAPRAGASSRGSRCLRRPGSSPLIWCAATSPRRRRTAAGWLTSPSPARPGVRLCRVSDRPVLQQDRRLASRRSSASRSCPRRARNGDLRPGRPDRRGSCPSFRLGRARQYTSIRYTQRLGGHRRGSLGRQQRRFLRQCRRGGGQFPVQEGAHQPGGALAGRRRGDRHNPEWVHWYNNEGLHSGQRQCTSAEYEKAWLMR